VKKPIAWVKYEELKDNGGRFYVSPLNRGLGVTIGNSMRRVLLSSLEGYAIAAVKIDDVKHEFNTIPDVIEDVLDIICNIKGLIVKCTNDESMATLQLDVNKKGKITAKDITPNAGVIIINPDHYIAELSEKRKLRIEMTLKKGVGYVPAEAIIIPDQSIDTINVDCSYSPIVKINHKVDKIRVGKELDYEQLVLDIWTNGSITAEEAAQEAAELLVKQFKLFGALNEEPEIESKVEDELSEEKAKTSALSLTIDDLELSARSSNCLKRAGIETVKELIEKDVSELIQIKNFGKKSSDEINDKLKQYSLELKTELQLENEAK